MDQILNEFQAFYAANPYVTYALGAMVFFGLIGIFFARSAGSSARAENAQLREDMQTLKRDLEGKVGAVKSDVDAASDRFHSAQEEHASRAADQMTKLEEAETRVTEAIAKFNEDHSAAVTAQDEKYAAALQASVDEAQAAFEQKAGALAGIAEQQGERVRSEVATMKSGLENAQRDIKALDDRVTEILGTVDTKVAAAVEPITSKVDGMSEDVDTLKQLIEAPDTSHVEVPVQPSSAAPTPSASPAPATHPQGSGGKRRGSAAEHLRGKGALDG